jgi:murein DD-endopeptidase MepM/ murein hydrolase activator NlpD
MIPLMFFAIATAQDRPPLPIIMPPKAVEPSGPIGQVELSPLFREDFVCAEHHSGQIPFAGDALGSDCMVSGGVEGRDGFSRLYRTDGRTNEDWYGWNAEVLAPTDGVIVGLLAKPEVNVPGTLGRPPAGMLQIRRDDGIIVGIGHVTNARVKIGDRVTAGQVVAVVGNNGMARNPHLHIGAWRESNAEPLQIRWDLRAMARLRAD